MKLPRAILFDHDGVLVASEALHWEAWGELLRELGLPYEEAEVRAMVGKTAPQILARLLDRHVPDWTPEQYDVEALARRKNDYYLTIAKTKLKPYPGVRPLLEWLRSNGIKTAVVSNAKRRELETALKQLELDSFFDAIVSRDDVRIPKPDPLPYLFAAACVGVKPEHSLAVEDSPPGLEAALIAEIPTAAVATNFGAKVLQSPVPGRPDLRPVWIGPSIEALAAWLKDLPTRH